MRALPHNDPHVKALLKQAFPGFTGRKVSMETREEVTLSGTYWSGGYRNSYAIVHVTQRVLLDMPQYNPPQFGGPPTPPVFKLSRDVVVCQLNQYAGKESVTLYVHPDNALGLLPVTVPENLTETEKVVMVGCQVLKAGDARFDYLRRRGISREKYQETVAGLAERGYMRKRGGFTVDGKNIVETLRKQEPKLFQFVY